MPILLIDSLSIGVAMHRTKKAKLDYMALAKMYPDHDKIVFFGRPPIKKRIDFAWALNAVGYELLFQPENDWLSLVQRFVKTDDDLTLATNNSATMFHVRGRKFKLLCVGALEDVSRYAVETQDIGNLIWQR